MTSGSIDQWSFAFEEKVLSTSANLSLALSDSQIDMLFEGQSLLMQDNIRRTLTAACAVSAADLLSLCKGN